MSDSNHIPAKAEATETIYTCPMHPEMRQPGSVDCPNFGMDLVPEAGGMRRRITTTPRTMVRQRLTAESMAPCRQVLPVCTRPMHPQVRQTHPGSCPLCGMALELESAAMADERPNPELVDFSGFVAQIG